MGLVTHDWRPEIVRLVQVKQAISEVDTEGLWEFHLPRVAANAESLRRVEQTLGVRLDPEYREFLSYADGWPSFFQSIDLFGTDDLAHGPRMHLASQLLAELDPAARERAGLRDVPLLPIAATAVDLDLFVMPIADGEQRPPVVWLAGYEIDRFATFQDFVLAMLEYNLRELSALRGG